MQHRRQIWSNARNERTPAGKHVLMVLLCKSKNNEWSCPAIGPQGSLHGITVLSVDPARILEATALQMVRKARLSVK